MAYFIFTKDLPDIQNTICHIAEDQSALNNLNITQSEFKIIQDSQENFNAVKLGTKHPVSYASNDTITYADTTTVFANKKILDRHIEMFKKSIKDFLDNNTNHPLYNQWSSYYLQLDDLDTNSITYPLNKSLEQHFSDEGQTSLNSLQIP